MHAKVVKETDCIPVIIYVIAINIASQTKQNKILKVIS